MGEYPGFHERLRARIAELEFKNPSRFADEYRYRITEMHKWLTTTMPSRANLERLAQDLGVTPWWLLFGDQPGVSKEPVPPRKRGARKIGCLVAALVFGATGMAPVKVTPHAMAQPAADTSYRKWSRRAWSGLALPVCA